MVLISGGAKGADRCAYEWGMVRLYNENNLEFPAGRDSTTTDASASERDN